jgi:hypothetical protein
MRTKNLIALIALVAVGFFVGRGSAEPKLPSAHGQGSAGPVIMAAANTQNEVFCFLYDPATRQLTSYMQRANTGIQLKSIRPCAWDSHTKFEEYPVSTSKTSVPNMRESFNKAVKKAKTPKNKKR